MGKLSAVLVLVLGLLAAAAPRAQAATTFVTSTGECYVTRLVFTADGCPIVKHGLAGYASASVAADLHAQTFDVAAAVRPDAVTRVGESNANSRLELVSGVVRSAGGGVKIVLTNVAGGISRQCERLCTQVGGAYGDIYLQVQLRLKDAATSERPSVFCTVTPSYAYTATLPSSLVIPDDCQSRQGKLDAPPNSTIDVVMSVYAYADSTGSGSASARFAGRISEIRVP